MDYPIRVMKNTTATIASHHNPELKIQIPALRAECGHTHGLFAVILPSANHDLESMRGAPREELDITTQYLKDLVRYLYQNMGCADLRTLRDEFSKLRL